MPVESFYRDKRGLSLNVFRASERRVLSSSESSKRYDSIVDLCVMLSAWYLMARKANGVVVALPRNIPSRPSSACSRASEHMDSVTQGFLK